MLESPVACLNRTQGRGQLLASLNAILATAAGLAIFVPLFLAVFVPRRLLMRATLWWLVTPAIAYVAVLLWEGSTRSGIENPWANAALGFSLLSAILLPPWLILNGLGYSIGLVLRRFTPACINIPQTPPDSHVSLSRPDNGLTTMTETLPITLGTKPGAEATSTWKRALFVFALLVGSALAIGTMTLLTESLKQQRPQELTPIPQVR
jgi:hypothetical protein